MINYDKAGLDRALDAEFGGDFRGELDDPGDDIGSVSAAASKRASRELYAKYRSACKGRRILKVLRKEKLDSVQESIMLQNRIKGLPQLFRDLDDLNRQSSRMSRAKYALRYAQLVTRLGYHPRYALTTLKNELEQAKCELSKNAWLFVAMCDGMEVDDPQNVSQKVAEHYARTELRQILSNPQVACNIDGSWCDVAYPNHVVIRVSFDKVPDFLIAQQVAPNPGPRREFAYSCFQGNLNLG